MMQAVNYIRSADEFGLAITTNVRDELGIEVDLRRTFATVVIGHRAHVPHDVRGQVSLALRTYNATLSRVQVISYDDLLDAAERALTFTI